MTINTGASEIEAFAMANCRHMLLTATASAGDNPVSGNDVEIGRTFRCKTCDRKFSSFQALGGHRASHKKTKPPSFFSGELSVEVLPSPVKPKVHICPICGKDFPIGQALGGHMRRHRSVGNLTVSGSTVTVENSNSNSDIDIDDNVNNNNNNHRSEKQEKKRRRNDDIGKSNGVKVPVNSKRMCTELDLELRLCSWNYDDVTVDDANVGKKEEGEIVEQDHKQVIEKKEQVKEVGEKRELLKLELRPPINFEISYK